MSNRVFAAYGVGVNRAEMAKHCPTAKLIGTAELKNYRLAFRGSRAGGLATIEKAKTASAQRRSGGGCDMGAGTERRWPARPAWEEGM